MHKITPEQYNPFMFPRSAQFMYTLIPSIRRDGELECWILNKKNMEMYHIKFVLISEFDVQIDLTNALDRSHILRIIMVLHMKEKILELFDEVPGVIYLKRLQCYRELYSSLMNKAKKATSVRVKDALYTKLEYLESEFPELII